MAKRLKFLRQHRHNLVSYSEGDEAEFSEEAASNLVRIGAATIVKAEPETEEEPVDVSEYHTGGGYYEIEGQRVQGKEAARQLLANLTSEG